jgi:hypothetical protein
MKKYFHICSMLILKLKNMLVKPKFKKANNIVFLDKKGESSSKKVIK